MHVDRRSDIVIGMTLAEVFLLILFVVWLSTAIDVSSDGNPEAPIDPEALRATVAKLQERLRSLERDKEDLRARVEALRDMLDAHDITDEALREALQRRIQEAKRGSPVCLTDNVLVHVSRTDGVDVLTVRQDTQSLLPGGRWAAGAQLQDEREIQEFLQAVQIYYHQAQKKCRFDYRLTYKTDADYRLGRTRYESQTFYNAGLRQTR
jgi:hypothetical protein